MSAAQKTATIAALDYARYICKARNTNLRNTSYQAACHDILTFLDAAKERVVHGLDLHDFAETTTQKEP